MKTVVPNKISCEMNENLIENNLCFVDFYESLG